MESRRHELHPSDEVWDTGLVAPDFAAFARSCGAFGVRVDRQDELKTGLEAVLAVAGLALVEVRTDPTSV